MKLYKAQFFFPFGMERGEFKRIKKFSECSGKCFQKHAPVSPHNMSQFNEYQYFHPHARELLFGGESMCFFEVKPEKIKDWRIEIKVKHDSPALSLKLDWVTAAFYDLDTGVLSFAVSWDEKTSKEGNLLRFNDALDINNLLRRSAPSFLGYQEGEHWKLEKKEALEPGEENGEAEKKNPPEPHWSDAQKDAGELAHEIKIVPAGASGCEDSELCENYNERFDGYFNVAERSGRPCPYTGRHFDFWLDKLKADGILQESSAIKLILDERNFVTSLILAEPHETGWKKPPESFDYSKEQEPENLFGNLDYESMDFRKNLYKAVFIDGSDLLYMSNKRLHSRLLQEHLYLRYKEQGSYYGFTRYSGVYLTHTGSEWFILANHFNSMYFQMTQLLLCMRTALLEFSCRAAELLSKVEKPDEMERTDKMKKIENLHFDVLKFFNKYWYSEVTCQEQGIEMFDLWNEVMGNRRLFDEVKNEIEALHDFSLTKMSWRVGIVAYTNIAALVLTLISAAVALAGFGVGGTAGCCVGLLMLLVLFLSGGWLVLHTLSRGEKYVDCIGEMIDKEKSECALTGKRKKP